MRCSVWATRLGELVVGEEGVRASRKCWASEAALEARDWAWPESTMMEI
jgi:hypothetical protein